MEKSRNAHRKPVSGEVLQGGLQVIPIAFDKGEFFSRPTLAEKNSPLFSLVMLSSI